MPMPRPTLASTTFVSMPLFSDESHAGAHVERRSLSSLFAEIAKAAVITPPATPTPSPTQPRSGTWKPRSASGGAGGGATTFGVSGGGAAFTWNESSIIRFFSPGRSRTFSSTERPSASSKRTVCSPGSSASACASIVSRDLAAVDDDLDVEGLLALLVERAEGHRRRVVLGLDEPLAALLRDHAGARLGRARDELLARGVQLAVVAELLSFVGRGDALLRARVGR